MKNTLFSAFIFAVGAAVGSAVTWRLLKTKYEQIAQEEEVFSKREKTTDEERPSDAGDKIEPAARKFYATEKPNLAEYAKIINNEGYAEEEEKGQDTMDEPAKKPYVISPDEFDEIYGYNTFGLTYYADGVLTDDDDEVVDNIDELVGLESLNTFGKYEEDSVFVRNEELQADFEILRDERNYSDIVKDKE